MVLNSFDHALVINLDRDARKYALAQQRLRKVGIEAERFSAIVPPDKGPYDSIGARGCTESHMACVRLAKERRYNTVLIFEDDVLFRSNFPSLRSRLQPTVPTLDYDILYLYDWGHLALTWFDLKFTPIAGTYCLHAYVVHSRFYDRMLELYSLNQSIGKTADDFIFNSKNAKLVAPNYNLAGQDAGMSDLTNQPKEIRWSAYSKTHYCIPFRI